jgi:hypothetical protein
MTDSKQKRSESEFVDLLYRRFGLSRKISDEAETLKLQSLGLVRIHGKNPNWKLSNLS